MFNKLKKKASLRAHSFKSSKGSYSFNDSVDDGGLSILPAPKKRSSLVAIMAINEDSADENSPRGKSTDSISPDVIDGTLSNEKLSSQKNGRFSSFFEPYTNVMTYSNGSNSTTSIDDQDSTSFTNGKMITILLWIPTNFNYL